MNASVQMHFSVKGGECVCGHCFSLHGYEIEALLWVVIN
jgi:hypothetical protein